MTAALLSREPVHLGPTWEPNPAWDGEDPWSRYLLPERTMGWQVLAWIRKYVNDEFGQPFQPTFEQSRFILWWYAVDDRGRFMYRNGVLQRLKGWGKDPVAAVLAIVEFLGPCRFSRWATKADVTDVLSVGDPVGKDNPAAWIQVAAVSIVQTQNTMRLLPAMLSDKLRRDHGIRKSDVGKEIIYAYGGRRQIQAVTSSPRALEGGRPTFIIKNEALALDTPIPTPSGWTTMGALQDGDVIFGDDGHPCTVTKAHPVQEGRRSFRVTFADGTSIVASDGHWWETKVASSAALPRRRTTLEMFEDGRTFMTPRAGQRVTKAVDLPVDPYLLGAWLGDGSTGACNLTASAEDAPALREVLAARGIETHLLKTQGAERISFSGRAGFGAGMGPDVAQALRALPCFRDKHIPSDYLAAGTEQRLELLRGLMDTDGHITAGNQAIFVGRERLAHDVLELVRSLGQVATANFVPDPRSREGGCWRVTFTPRDIQPFAMPRKAALVGQGKRDWASIKSVEEVRSVPVRCISVDSPTRLFQAGEAGHVTSNTHHWLGNNEGHEMAGVIERNATKSRDGAARSLSITNAYDPAENSVAQVERESWETELAGLAIETGMLYDSLEWDAEISLRPPKTLERGDPTDDEIKAWIGALVSAVRGDASWLDVEGITKSVLDRKNPISRSRRYWLNTIDSAEDAWAAAAAVRAAASSLVIRDAEHDLLRAGWLVLAEEPVVLFGDGSKSDDSTGLVGCRLSDGYVFTVGVWQKPPGKRGENWLAPRGEVASRVHEAMDRFNVVAFWFDPSHTKDDEDGSRYWDTILDELHRQYKDRLQLWAVKIGDRQHSIMWDMTSPERSALFVGGAETFVEEVEHKDPETGEPRPLLEHDGHPALVQHLLNAKRYPTRWGVSLWKGHRESDKKVDLAVCAVGARLLRRIVLNKGLEDEEKKKQPGTLWGG